MANDKPDDLLKRQGDYLVWDVDDYCDDPNRREKGIRIDCGAPDAAAVLAAEEYPDNHELKFPRTFVVLDDREGRKYHVSVNREVRFEYEATDCEEQDRPRQAEMTDYTERKIEELELSVATFREAAARRMTVLVDIAKLLGVSADEWEDLATAVAAIHHAKQLAQEANVTALEQCKVFERERDEAVKMRSNACVAVGVAQEYIAVIEKRESTQRDNEVSAIAARDAAQNRLREVARECAECRKTLNTIADMLHTVHEDPKIIRRVRDLLDGRPLDSGDLQLVCLALAECELRRPGWNYAIDQLATKLGGDEIRAMISAFRGIHADNIRPIDAFLAPSIDPIKEIKP